jgi:STE24 endopeptidase
VEPWALPPANGNAIIPAHQATSDFACATTPSDEEEQMQRRIVLMAVFAAVLAMLTSTSSVRGQAAATPAPQTPTGAMATTSTSEHFDPAAATNAYLAKVPPDKKARSDAYFEGGYWLILWDFLASSIVFLLLLVTGLSARMRDLAERVTRFKPIHTFLYWTQFFVLTSLLTFPLGVYEGFIREHKYGLATQTFGPWLGDQLKGLGLGIVFLGLLMVVLYGIVRRLPRTWWIWGAIVSLVFAAFMLLIAPVFIAPLFNKYTRLEDPAIRDPILSLARANGISAKDVFVQDASRQTTRVSAFVIGFLNTERIVLNDNLLKRCSLAEIETVMGHEMGHYVMHHAYKDLLFFGIVVVLGFAFLRKASEWALGRWGDKWRAHAAGDLAALPLFALLISSYFFVLTPILNTYSRVQEYEADIFGLNAARQPDAEAEVDLKLGEYRKLDPGPIEEFLFYDHPSGRTRIYAAMRWKAEHLRELGNRQ